jgi:hypothetical protein
MDLICACVETQRDQEPDLSSCWRAASRGSCAVVGEPRVLGLPRDVAVVPEVASGEAGNRCCDDEQQETPRARHLRTGDPGKLIKLLQLLNMHYVCVLLIGSIDEECTICRGTTHLLI